MPGSANVTARLVDCRHRNTTPDASRNPQPNTFCTRAGADCDIGKLNLEFEKIEHFEKPVTLADLREVKKLSRCELLKLSGNNHGNLNAITPEEYRIIRKMTAAAFTVESEKGLREGDIRARKTSVRNAQLRAKAKRHYGLKCYCCGFEFARFYGGVAKNLAIVHHLNQQFEGERTSNVNDVWVVCANCHQVIHVRKEPIHVDDLKGQISERWTDWSDDGVKSKR